MQIKLKIFFLSLLTLSLFSCQKAIIEEPETNLDLANDKVMLRTSSTLAASDSFDAGAVHNAMLNDYYQNISTDATFFTGFDTSNYVSLFSSKIQVMTENYIAAGNYEASLTAIGATNAAAIIQDLIDSSAYYVENYSTILAGTSSSFQSAISALTHIITNYWSASNFASRVTLSKNKFSGRMPTEVENAALENAYSIALASQLYWSQNTATWDALFPTSSFSAFSVTSAGPGDIILADMVGGITGTIKGAVRGAAAGPGGATIGGIIGVVAGAASSSITAYGWSRLSSWIFG